MTPPDKPSPTFREALRFWFTLGFINFGGPAGQISIMQTELVDRRGWIEQDAFLRALNFCMLLPGPEAQQLATYIGWKLHGLKGALAAGVLFVVPGALLLFGLAWIAAAHGDTTLVSAVFAGLKPVVVALVLHAVWRIGKRVLRDGTAVALAVAAFAAVELAHVPFPLVVVAAGIFGWLRPAAQVAPAATAFDGRAAVKRILGLAVLYVVMLLVPLALVVFLAGPDPYLTLGRFMTQAAFVTFGGAYAVLPYVADAAVNQFHWLSADEMINGLALAETTPGPLILVLQYVGFFTGWNAGGAISPLAAAGIGAGVATYTTFLPSIFLILAGAPYIERIAGIRKAAGALTAITAAVVGVIATLGVFLGRQVIFTRTGEADIVAILAILIAFAALVRFKIELHWVVLAGALFGLARATLIF